MVALMLASLGLFLTHRFWKLLLRENNARTAPDLFLFIEVIFRDIFAFLVTGEGQEVAHPSPPAALSAPKTMDGRHKSLRVRRAPQFTEAPTQRQHQLFS